MRAVASEVDPSKARVGSRPGARPARLRKSRLKSHLRALALESREKRALLATIPAALVGTNQIDISNSGGNQSSPSIAVNPVNSSQLVAVWTRLVPSLAPGPQVIAEGAVSNNGGTTWTPFSPATILIDPTSSATAPALYAQTTDASVDFDRNGNFYVVVSEHSADNSSGSLLLNKFSFGSGSPTKTINNEVLYAWTADQALKPIVAVDKNLATFTDGTFTQTDPSAGNVYVAWA